MLILLFEKSLGEKKLRWCVPVRLLPIFYEYLQTRDLAQIVPAFPLLPEGGGSSRPFETNVYLDVFITVSRIRGLLRSPDVKPLKLGRILFWLLRQWMSLSSRTIAFTLRKLISLDSLKQNPKNTTNYRLSYQLPPPHGFRALKSLIFLFS